MGHWMVDIRIVLDLVDAHLPRAHACICYAHAHAHAYYHTHAYAHAHPCSPARGTRARVCTNVRMCTLPTNTHGLCGPCMRAPTRGCACTCACACACAMCMCVRQLGAVHVHVHSACVRQLGAARARVRSEEFQSDDVPIGAVLGQHAVHMTGRAGVRVGTARTPRNSSRVASMGLGPTP